MADIETIWDGKFIQHMPHDEAVVAQGAGLAQIFAGPDGYQPGFVMKDPSEFPFAPPAFYPLDLFLPGDIGGFYNTNVIGSLFQDRTGPTNPVTANGQGVSYIVDQHGQFDLSRPTATQAFIYEDGVLLPVFSDGAVTSLTAGNVSGFSALTVVVAGYADVAAVRGAQVQQLIWTGMSVGQLAAGAVSMMLDIGTTVDANRAYIQNTSGTLSQIPVTDSEFSEPYVFGAEYDYVGTQQRIFINDLENVSDISMVAPATGFRYTTSIWADAAGAQVWNGPAFFINRKLSTTELTQLKTWMRDNTRTP